MADMHQPAQERACRQHDGPGRVAEPGVVLGADHPPARHHQPLHQRLLEVEPGLGLDPGLHGHVVALLVVLRPGRVHRRTLLGVQGAELDGGAVGDLRHLAAEGVDLLDQLPLGHAADRGAARHGRKFVEVDRQQQHAAAHAGRGQRCLAAGVSGADDEDVVGGGGEGHEACLLQPFARPDQSVVKMRNPAHNDSPSAERVAYR
jgi:hypothetical protein